MKRITNPTRLKNEFKSLASFFNVLKDIKSITIGCSNNKILVSFKYRNIKLEFIIYSLIQEGYYIGFSSITSHYLLIKGNIGPYKHTSGPRETPELAMKDAMTTFFHLLNSHNGIEEFKWVQNECYQDILQK